MVVGVGWLQLSRMMVLGSIVYCMYGNEVFKFGDSLFCDFLKVRKSMKFGDDRRKNLFSVSRISKYYSANRFFQVGTVTAKYCLLRVSCF